MVYKVKFQLIAEGELVMDTEDEDAVWDAFEGDADAGTLFNEHCHGFTDVKVVDVKRVAVPRKAEDK